MKAAVFVQLAQIEAGAAGGASYTITLTDCVTAPEALVAVIWKTLVVPPSATGGV